MMNNFELRDKIEKIIDSNCEEIPYEGTLVYKSNILEEICTLIEEYDSRERTSED